MSQLNTSYVSGTGSKPLLYKTIAQAFDDAVSNWGQREAVVVRHQNIRWTYQQLADAADQFATGLVALGLQPGERIGIWSPNKIEWIVTVFAAAKAGLVLVNINPAYRLAELEYALDKVGCRAIVIADQFKSSDYVGMIRQLAPEIETSAPGELNAERLPELRTVIHIGADEIPGFFRFKDIAARGGDAERAAIAELTPNVQPDDAANIQFTSGTTGFPKGATLTHFNIVNNGYLFGQGMVFTEADRLCIPVPLYHCFGMVMGVLTCITHGATMIFPSEAFGPEPVLQTVAEEKCTALHGVPTMFIAELDHPNFNDYDLSSLRTGCMAGAPCPIEVMKRVFDQMHMNEITIGYGMTETSPVSTQTGVDDPMEKRVSTVGKVHPHVQLKVIDEQGRTVPRGESGELCTRGYNVMLGYWGDEEKTTEAIDQAGWMHTGDLGTIDDEGYCNIVGRVKDMIIRGGENIYPREIEEFLFRNPKIQDVSVFGVPDEKYGEEVCAWIKLRDGEECSPEEVVAFCKDQIAHYKVPRYIRFVDAFPMTVTGKIQKFVMSDSMKEELNLGERKTA